MKKFMFLTLFSSFLLSGAHELHAMDIPFDQQHPSAFKPYQYNAEPIPSYEWCPTAPMKVHVKENWRIKLETQPEKYSNYKVIGNILWFKKLITKNTQAKEKGKTPDLTQNNVGSNSEKVGSQNQPPNLSMWENNFIDEWWDKSNPDNSHNNMMLLTDAEQEEEDQHLLQQLQQVPGTAWQQSKRF